MKQLLFAVARIAHLLYAGMLGMLAGCQRQFIYYSIFPVGLFLRERYNNLTALEGYSGPVAFMLAERDEVVPASLGMRLYEEYDGPKKLIVQEGRTHNTLEVHAGAAWWDDISEFLKGSYQVHSESPSGSTHRVE